MAQDKNKTPRTTRYTSEDGKIAVEEYDFLIKEGNRQGELIPMVEISKLQNKWSKEFSQYIEAKRSVSFTKEQFAALLLGLKQ